VFRDFLVRRIAEARLHFDPIDDFPQSSSLRPVANLPLGSLSDAVRAGCASTLPS